MAERDVAYSGRHVLCMYVRAEERKHTGCVVDDTTYFFL